MTVPVTREWVTAAGLAAAEDQLVFKGAAPVPNAVERMDALLRAWAVGFHARRPDVASAQLQHGSRGLHADECASFLRALDARLLHVDSAGYVVPLCAEPKPGQTPYALCCKNGSTVGVNLEYIIQLGVLAELAMVYRWPTSQLRMELGEFDASAVDAQGKPAVLMEAKARVSGGQDTLDRLLLKWLGYAQGPRPPRGTNASNKYVELLTIVQATGPLKVLLAAAGARWWLQAVPVRDDRLELFALAQ
jgi:hypothetical protein